MKIIELCYLKWKLVMLEQPILLFWLGREAPCLLTNDVMGSIVEGEILVHVVERDIDKEKFESSLILPLTLTRTVLSVSDSCRRRSIYRCWDMYWRLFVL